MTMYSESQRKLQDEFDSRNLAEALEHGIVNQNLDERQMAFVASRDFFFLATVTSSGEPTVSYKGGGVGLVTVLDPCTLAFPAYDGNGMMLSWGNIEDTAKIAMLFIDFETPNRLRVQATATLHREDELLVKYPGAFVIVRASIDSCFVNCARYIHRHERVADSKYVPADDGSQPFATWKRIDVMQPVLSPEDQAAAQETGVISEAEYGAKLLAGES